jgi:hypothetical protein
MRFFFAKIMTPRFGEEEGPHDDALEIKVESNLRTLDEERRTAGSR